MTAPRYERGRGGRVGVGIGDAAEGACPVYGSVGASTAGSVPAVGTVGTVGTVGVGAGAGGAGGAGASGAGPRSSCVSRVRNHSTAAPSADEQHRPERAVAADVHPEPAPDRGQPERDEAVAEQLPAVGVGRLDAGRGRRHREHDPAEEVGDHAHTTEERGDDERQAHEDHVDAQVVGHPARHPAQQAFVGAARQPPGRGRRSGGRGVGPGRVGPRVGSGRRCVHGRDHPRPARWPPSGIPRMAP